MGDFYKPLKEKHPKHLFEPKDENVCTQILVNLIRMSDKMFYHVLRSRFRAALTVVFGDELKNW
ncbi:MAG: hypothetical protein ACOX6D_07585 [Thermoguttaceae bacterium]